MLAVALEHTERLTGASDRVQGPHEHLHRPFPQRVRCREVARLRGRLRWSAAGGQQRRPVFQRREPQLFQAGGGGAGEAIGEFPIGGPAPQRQRLFQQDHGGGRVLGCLGGSNSASKRAASIVDSSAASR